MKSSNFFLISSLVALLVFSGCGGSTVSVGPPSGPPANTYTGVVGSNTMEITVNGSLCSASTEYLNEPCTSITICSPGTTNCQTINNILVDTGSYGLRIFASQITVPLNPVTDSSGNTLAECAEFGTGADWGSVQKADVVMGNLSLGGETASNVPIQVIDPTFSGFQSSWCNSGQVDQNPTGAGFNGILGVGLFGDDCGPDCDPNEGNDVNNGMYFACANGTCNASTLVESEQVTNPVQLLPVDNNGVVLNLPAVADGGTPSTIGVLILGIGTQANNTPGSGVTKFLASSSYGEFYTQFNGKMATAIIDSGTNAYNYDMTMSTCGSGSDFYCPSSETTLTGTIVSSDNSVSANVNFDVGNLNSFSGYNWVFSDVGVQADQDGTFFIWGVPFFMGRTVYVGLYGTSSVQLGAGPYWAY